MTKPRAVLLGLLMILVCSGVAIYRGHAFDVRRIVAVDLCGAGVLFVAAFSPGLSAIASALLLADVLVLNPKGVGLVDAVGSLAAPGASTVPAVPTKQAATKVASSVQEQLSKVSDEAEAWLRGAGL
jgi:hypothetical protein